MLRKEIQRSKETQASLVKKYNVTSLIIRKWPKRAIFVDKSHRPGHLKTIMCPLSVILQTEHQYRKSFLDV